MKIYKGYQFRGAVEELIRKIAGFYNVNDLHIVWSSDITTAGVCSNGTMYISNVADDAVLNHRDLVKWVGFGVHEILHMLYTDFYQRADDEYTKAIHNAVEDAWIEHRGIAKGVTGNVESLLSELIDIMTTEALGHVTDWADPMQYPFVLAVYLRDHAHKKVPLADGLEPIFQKARARLNKCHSSADTLKLAEWIVKQLENPPQDQDKSKQADGEGDGEGEGDPLDGVGQMRKPNRNLANDPEPKLNPGKKGGIGWFDTGNINVPLSLEKKQWARLGAKVPARLRYEVKRLFDNSGIEEFVRNRRTGSVDVHALRTHSYNDKVFKLRRATEGVDTAVVIVLDASGSMFTDGCGTSRMETAIQTCAVLLETLQKAQVATCVLVFGDGTSIAKPFNMSLQKFIPTLTRLNAAGGTNDYIAIRHAHTLLLNRPEQRKICFAITDGEGDITTTKLQCEAGERLGVTTIGVGIELNVSPTYPQNVTVDNIRDLATVSFKQIKLAA